MLGVFGGRTLATAVLILAVLPGEAQAQKRVFARVQPDANGGEKLNFDVNQVTSDNVAPNLVVAADGKRGFVSYGGSGAVMAFSLLTGEILARIKTGGAPAFATPLPGGRALAVVSVLENKVPDNKVFLIDMDASELRSTFTFPDAKFGFGSIVSASPDGTIGYVSSTGTGEVIKFSLADGAELGRFKGMQGPAQITVTPDGATILVVDTLTEEVLFIDAANLTKKATLKGKDSTVNFTIFNKPVLSPDGSTGIIAARTADTVLHFRTSDGEILDSATIGTAPGFTTLTPDGKHWAILNDLSLTLIGTEDFKDLKDLSTVKGGPLGSANIVFSPDSRYAFYASSSSDLIFQHDLQTGAVVAQVLVGDSPNKVLDEPATLAATPDGKIVAAVDFLSNTIELLTDKVHRRHDLPVRCGRQRGRLVENLVRAVAHKHLGHDRAGLQVVLEDQVRGGRRVKRVSRVGRKDYIRRAQRPALDRAQVLEILEILGADERQTQVIENRPMLAVRSQRRETRRRTDGRRVQDFPVGGPEMQHGVRSPGGNNTRRTVGREHGLVEYREVYGTVFPFQRGFLCQIRGVDEQDFLGQRVDHQDRRPIGRHGYLRGPLHPFETAQFRTVGQGELDDF